MNYLGPVISFGCTPSTAELWLHFEIFQESIVKYDVQPVLTLLEVKSLFETLKIEFEAKMVK